MDSPRASFGNVARQLWRARGLGPALARAGMCVGVITRARRGAEISIECLLCGSAQDGIKHRL
eukprot:11353017-Prorocentrum_lima.AAC.1